TTASLRSAGVRSARCRGGFLAPRGAVKVSSPGLGMAVPVSQIQMGDLRVSAATPVGGGRRWSPLSGLGRPRDGPAEITHFTAEAEAARWPAVASDVLAQSARA